RPAVLLNESRPGQWIRLELVGTLSNRSAVGASVVVHAGGRVFYRQVKGGGGFASANDPRLLIGVGEGLAGGQDEDRWARGRKGIVSEPAVGRSHRVVEPAGDSPSAANGPRMP